MVKPKKNTIVSDLKIEIEILHQIIEVLSATDNPPDLLQRISQVLCLNLKGDSCFIYLIDGDGLKLTGAWPPHPVQVGKIRLQKGEGITGWVAQHEKCVSLSKHASKDARFKFFPGIPEDKFEAFLSVPISLNGQVIGVINLFNKKPRVFGKNIQRLLKSAASQAANAIERMRFVESTGKRAKQLETISHLSKTIAQGKYLNEILQLIVTMTAQMMNSKVCSLMLFNAERNELKIEATQSLSDEYKQKPPIKVDKSVSGRALLSGKTVSVRDVTKEAVYGYPGIALKEGLKSMIAAPMFVHDKPIGVINCYSTTEHEYTPDETEIMQTIANQAAIAIENTKLLEESNNAKEELLTRKTTERAKGLLMKERGISESEAFRFIQKQAMNLRRSMREIAEAIILSDGLKTNKGSQKQEK